MKEYHIKIPSPDKRKRHNLFVVAFNHFPENLAATAVGIAFLSAPLLYNLFREQGISSVIVRIILTGAVIAIVPLLILYLVTLLRSVGIREKLESQNEDELKSLSDKVNTLHAEEIEKEKAVLLLEQKVKGESNARKIKDKIEDERWQTLNERLDTQEQVDRQTSDNTEVREVARQESDSQDNNIRKKKENFEEDRWDALFERLRIMEQRGDEHDRWQRKRDEEHVRLRANDELKEQYKTLFARYIRSSPDRTSSRDVAAGIAPIPEAWLQMQPEILKNPELANLLQPYNER